MGYICLHTHTYTSSLRHIHVDAHASELVDSRSKLIYTHTSVPVYMYTHAYVVSTHAIHSWTYIHIIFTHIIQHRMVCTPCWYSCLYWLLITDLPVWTISVAFLLCVISTCKLYQLYCISWLMSRATIRCCN